MATVLFYQAFSSVYNQCKSKNLGLFLVFTFKPIEDGPFRSYSRMEGAKRPLSLKFVTYILQ